MKIRKIQQTREFFVSSIHPEIMSENPNDKQVIAWCDARPVVWDIVMTNKSKAFGKSSCEYIGWAQNNDSGHAILERARSFRENIVGANHFRNPRCYRAAFTLAHFHKKLKSGFFVQHDETPYPRLCMTMDYTDDALQEIVECFLSWCSHGANRYPTKYVTLHHPTKRKRNDPGIVVWRHVNCVNLLEGV